MSTSLLKAGNLLTRGHGLHRPECVIHAENGDIYVSDWRGGVTLLRADGVQQTWLAKDAPVPLRPNGIAITPEGDFLIANLGDEGGIWRMDRDGHVTPVLTQIDGHPAPPMNFVTTDADGRIWATVSTARLPRQSAWRRDVADGFMVMVEDGHARVMADGLHYTNEARISPCGRWLYVVETFGQRLIRFPLGDDLGAPECVVQMEGCWLPDGFAFDAQGGIWITSLLCNGLMRLAPDGGRQIVLMEHHQDHTAPILAAWAQGQMPGDALGPIPGARLQHVTSIGFGGPDGRDAVIGTLHNDCVFAFRADFV